MFPSLDPKKMQAMMKQLGIAQEEISAERVVIEGKNSKKIIIENPSIVKIKMKGQESFQITGDVREVEESEESANKTEDIKILMEKIGCSENEARDALKKTNGDLTEAILSLS